MINQIIKKFMNLPMKLKLFSFGCGLIFVSTSLSAVAVYGVTSKIIRKNSLQYTNEIMAQSQNYLDEKFKTLLLKTNYLQLNKDFQEIMTAIWFRERGISTSDRAKITDLLGQIKNGDEGIDSIYLSAGDYEFYTYEWGQPWIGDFMDSSLYLEMENKNRIDWGVEGKDVIFQNRRSTIPIVLPVTLYNLKIDNQFLVINLNAGALRQELLEMEKAANGKLFIWNEGGEVVLSGTGSEEEANILLGLLPQPGKENKDYQASVRLLDTNGWSIGCLQNKQTLLQDVKRIGRMIGAIGVFSVILFSFIAMILSDTITRPMKKLQELMAQAADNGFQQTFSVKYDDEIGRLAKGFNEMCIRIQRLMTEVKEEQRQKRKAELRSLNAQINPHFLYNTMDCIYWASMKDGNPEIAEVAVNISNIFRLGLNKGKEMTTVDKEVRHVTSYLEIQKTIYKSSFEYEIFMDDKIKDWPVIKLLLQPLAENSIIHGFKQMEGGGKIWITAGEEDGALCFRVSDNGCGMEENEIENHMTGEKENGLAISNIAQRLRLHYGSNSSLCYKRREEQGITAEIRIFGGENSGNDEI